MTVDVEDYFQVSAFENRIRRDEWDRFPSRVESNTRGVLELFSERGVKATFFVLGWVAERYPSLVRELVSEGHEIASHGFSHVRATEQTPEEFLDDVSRTKAVLEDVSGTQVKGFRAASFSIDRRNLWALDVLGEAGYSYSSSIFPVNHDLYGMPGAPRFPFHFGEGGILEIPITTLVLLGLNFPCSGGGYFRLLPYGYTRWALRRINRREGRAAVFYFHPWEIDAEQPRQSGVSLRSRFRHYTNLAKTRGRLARLLGDFHWGRMDRVYLADGARRRHQTVEKGRLIAAPDPAGG